MCPPCFSRTGRVPRRLPSLDWVLLSRVPQRHQYYEGATTSPSRCPVAYDVRFQVPRGDLSRSLQSGRKSLPDDLARFQCPGPKGYCAWRSRGPHRFPGDPSRISALLTDPGRTARPSRKRNERCCPRIQHDEGSGEQHDVEAQSHGFDTHYLRFGRRVATEPARLASGRSLAFTGRESNPLDRNERFRTVFYVIAHPPFLGLSCR